MSSIPYVLCYPASPFHFCILSLFQPLYSCNRQTFFSDLLADFLLSRGAWKSFEVKLVDAYQATRALFLLRSIFFLSFSILLWTTLATHIPFLFDGSGRSISNLTLSCPSSERWTRHFTQLYFLLRLHLIEAIQHQNQRLTSVTFI